jgi:hypothetical protein
MALKPFESEYASDYMGNRGGGTLGTTEHFDEGEWDLETSQKLTEMKKMYGPAYENRIAQIWQRLNAEGSHVVAQPYDGQTNMAKAQNYFMQYEAPQLGLRSAYKKSKNPMLF